MGRAPCTFAWLIELAASRPRAPTYFCDVWGGGVRWSMDHNKAKRFDSEAEAKVFAAENIDVAVRVCEHGWG
jgi:hypothetical protein